MRIFITGADGQVGYELQHRLAEHTLIPAIRPQFDLLKLDVEQQILAAEPQVVIHAAAYTQVDKAEQEPEVAMAVNAEGTERVAMAAAKAGARLIYLSTDYVFDGRKGEPYNETDDPNPLSVYGRSKLEGERQALAICPNTLVVRTSWLYGLNGNNFVKTIMRLAVEQSELQVVDDQRGCPTYAGDLAEALARVLTLNLRGVVHAVGTGDCTWHEFACAIVSLMGQPVSVRAISTAEAKRPARRPPYSVLTNQILARSGITLPDWRDALMRFMAQTEVRVA